MRFIINFRLFPLDCACGLGSTVVTYSVDFGDYSLGDFVENCPVDMLDRSRHCIDGIYGTDNNGPLIETTKY